MNVDPSGGVGKILDTARIAGDSLKPKPPVQADQQVIRDSVEISSEARQMASDNPSPDAEIVENAPSTQDA